ncbi:MAG TPA: universal stress protein [Candidatus Cybelea sp.]|jgi:nucleotide-binding universal stress UspA family protein|nr:universal stress protein [Candidatus Cybelea sp.]
MLPPKRILSPIDFSDPSNEALETAADLAARFDSELLLVHVVPMLPRLPSPAAIFNEAEYEQELQRDGVERLAGLAGKLTANGMKVRSEVGTANDVGMEIVRLAEHDQADLIVIATHGMTGWHRLAFGSVAEKVVRLAACPVLLLRARVAGKPASLAAVSG